MAWISEAIGSFWPTFQPIAVDEALARDGAGARLAKASRCAGAMVNSGYMSR